jgi:hypothetical protein
VCGSFKAAQHRAGSIENEHDGGWFVGVRILAAEYGRQTEAKYKECPAEAPARIIRSASCATQAL